MQVLAQQWGRGVIISGEAAKRRGVGCGCPSSWQTSERLGGGPGLGLAVHAACYASSPVFQSWAEGINAWMALGPMLRELTTLYSRQAGSGCMCAAGPGIVRCHRLQLEFGNHSVGKGCVRADLVRRSTLSHSLTLSPVRRTNPITHTHTHIRTCPTTTATHSG